MNVSIVVPVFNSEGTLSTLVRRLKSQLETLTSAYELILINDGSLDGSWERIRQLALEYDWVRGIDLMNNYGQHNALLCGIRNAQYDIIVTMDDDLQHPPEEIPKLLEKLSQGYDVIYAIPQKECHSFWRNWASRITKLILQSVMGAEMARNISAFRAFRSKLRDAFASYNNEFVSIDVLLTWGTKRFGAIPVRHEARIKGRSQYTFRKLITHSLNMMTGYSTLPLQVSGIMGFGLILFGLVLMLYVIGRYILEGGSVPGFPFLASIIIIFSGAQLFSLGIMGVYLGRLHVHNLGRPHEVIRGVVGGNNPGKKSA